MNDTDLNTTDAEIWLTQNGWREYPNQFKKYARCFYKQFDTQTRCFGNDDRPGIQVELAVSETDGLYRYTLEIVAGMKDGTWLRLENYALSDSLKEVIKAIPRLLAAWEAANQPTNSKNQG